MTGGMSEPVLDGGIGARVRRKEDERHLHGRGRFVADIRIPGLQDVAFLRSPLAHARIRSIGKPPGYEIRVFTRADMRGAASIVANSSLPTSKPSEQPPLADGKVRFVGEPIAMAYASTRADAEDILESVECELEELPALADAFTARQTKSVRVHEHWDDNLFLTLTADSGSKSMRASRRS